MKYPLNSIWHPIVEPVEQQPLTLCDYRTAKFDAHAADLIFPHIATENQLIQYSESQKWYFIDRQRVEEAWMFKVADSASSESPEISKCKSTRPDR
jgi:hypothetical protein